MEIVYEKGAFKSLRRMQPKRKARIVEVLLTIAADPFGPHGSNLKRKKGSKATFIYRAADFRAVYRIDRAAQVMTVELVKPRGEVYK